MKRGRLICIEGPDAVGKATQSKLLAEKLGAVLISFPRYETEIGKAIRGNVTGEWTAATVDWRGKLSEELGRDDSMNALARQALFLLDRYDAAPGIEAALRGGTDVVLDRHWPSGVVYGAADGLDEQMLIRAHQHLPQPDLFILLDVPLEEGFRRRPERRDLYERSVEKMEDVRWRYKALFQRRAGLVHKYECAEAMDRGTAARCICDVRKWVTVDGVGTIEEVYGRILGVIS